MNINKEQISACIDEAKHHLTKELLPFWMDRCKDDKYGGFITHFDEHGNAVDKAEKSMLAQARTVYSMASAHRAGYGNGKCLEYAKHGVDFLINKMWDNEHDGFYWISDYAGNITDDKKILYGHSFIIYALSEYTIVTGDPHGQEYAEKSFDLLQKYAVDTMYGGYFEMFERKWELRGPGAEGGDRKTLDVHMHLMEAFTTLYECTGNSLHRRKLLEDVELLFKHILHPQYATGIPQFFANWTEAPQIKFETVWGWDRFTDRGVKPNAKDNTSAGHNSEFAWLLMHAMDVIGENREDWLKIAQKQLDHTVANGIDHEFGGVYVEGPHSGGVSDMEKEFWQQAEVLIGMLEGCLRFNTDKYWEPYMKVHRFTFDKGINHAVGEWWPLLTREGEPIWRHMSHSWKVNYHSIRSMIQSIIRLEKLLKKV